MRYTERVDGFQIQDVTYIGLPPKDAPPRFAVVKWYTHDEPIRAIDMYTGEEREVTESCYVVGDLVWNSHEDYFYFQSIGMRWFEEKPSEAVVQMVMDFAEKKGKEIREQEEWR